MWLTWLQQNPILSLLIGLALGGIISGLSLFVGNLCYRHATRPALAWGDRRARAAHLAPPTAEEVVAASLTHVTAEKGLTSTPAEIPFYSSMIAVHNRGKSAAENCTGHLEIGGNREHVCWFLPGARRTITINRGDFEFLEICGWQEPDNASVGTRKRIAPTENGWQRSGKNRDLDHRGTAPIQAHIVVTSANAGAIRLPILIRSIDDLQCPQDESIFVPLS